MFNEAILKYSEGIEMYKELSDSIPKNENYEGIKAKIT